MIAFDTDVLTEILLGNTTFAAHASAIPASQQAVPIIVGRRDYARQIKCHPASRSRQIKGKY